MLGGGEVVKGSIPLSFFITVYFVPTGVASDPFSQIITFGEERGWEGLDA